MLDVATIRARASGETAMRAILDAETAAPRRGPLAQLFGLHPLRTPLQSAYADALASLALGEELSGLGPRWDLLHDVPVGDGRTLEHLILGPAGVFALRAVRGSGSEVVIDGDQLACRGRTEDLGRLREDAGRVAMRFLYAGIPVEVRPAIVIVGDARYVVRLPARGIQVVALPQVGRWLGSMRRVLTGDDVAALSDVVDRPSTWPAVDLEVGDPSPGFEALRERVRLAARRRSVWSAAGFAAGFAAIWTSAAVLVATTLSA